jgi:hypothetical protein
VRVLLCPSSSSKEIENNFFNLFANANRPKSDNILELPQALISLRLNCPLKITTKNTSFLFSFPLFHIAKANPDAHNHLLSIPSILSLCEKVDYGTGIFVGWIFPFSRPTFERGGRLLKINFHTQINSELF